VRSVGVGKSEREGIVGHSARTSQVGRGHPKQRPLRSPANTPVEILIPIQIQSFLERPAAGHRFFRGDNHRWF